MVVTCTLDLAGKFSCLGIVRGDTQAPPGGAFWNEAIYERHKACCDIVFTYTQIYNIYTFYNVCIFMESKYEGLYRINLV